MKNLKRNAVFSLKLAVSLLILYLLISRIGTKPVIEAAGRIPALFLAVVILIHFAIMYISALRTGLLLKYSLSLRSLLSISAITYFFNTFTPANMGGDFVKIYFLKKESRKGNPDSSISDAVAPVFVERFMGLVVTLTLCLIFLPYVLKYFYDVRNLWLFPMLMFLFLLSIWMVLHFRIGSSIKAVASFHDSLRHFKDRKRNIYSALFYSLVIQILNIIIICILSSGLGLTTDNLYYFSIMPLITLINLIPISIGGLGIREGSFVFFLNFAGIPADKAITLSLLSFAATAAASLPGFVEYLRYRNVLKEIDNAKL